MVEELFGFRRFFQGELYFFLVNVRYLKMENIKICKLKIFMLSSFLFMNFINNANSMEINITPSVGYIFPMDKLLKRYFDRNSFKYFGFDLSILNHRNNLGIYFKYLRFSFKVDDVHYTNGWKLPIEGNRYSIGIQKSFNLLKIPFYGRAGLNINNDSYLQEFTNWYNKLGLHTGLGFKYNFSKYFNYILEVDLIYSPVKILEYVNCCYSRHNYYLSGELVQNGGLLIQTGISFLIPITIEKFGDTSSCN